jgi:MoxR-like ATPase
MLELNADLTFRGTCPQNGAALVHLFDERQVRAVNLALQLERPLLVRGEPGCGKSQLARAVACSLGAHFDHFVFDAQTEGRDLLYQIDLVQRLADAQLGSVTPPADAASGPAPGAGGSAGRDLPIEDYLVPGPLWRALNWESARQYPRRQLKQQVDREAVPQVHGPTENQRTVLLLDEVDKADPSAPNSLLGILADRSFKIPEIGLIRRDGRPFPLIVLTTNEERDLPGAFLRRCVVLYMGPSSEADVEAWLVKHGPAHYSSLDKDVLAKAAKDLVCDRKVAKEAQRYGPGLSEYIDLLRTLEDLKTPNQSADQRRDSQLQELLKIEEFLIRKDRERP